MLLSGGTLVLQPNPAAAQAELSVRVEENFRREPNGVVLARLAPGTELRALRADGNWTEVELGGFVWLRSLQASEDPEFDLVVSQTDGENLRAGPSGTILGRLEEGALLTEVSRDAAWARVTRRGWIWTGSLTGTPATSSTPPATSAGQGASTGSTTARPSGPSARNPGGFTRVGGPILTAPDGDTLAIATPSREIQVLRREGNWARVRLEGWLWMPAAADAAPAEGATDEPEALEPTDLSGDPHGFDGRIVSWTVQFISLERAEAVRTDFFEGEPFLLSRFGAADGPFVYIAVPNERLSEVEGLVPLERISVTGRIRTGASALTGAPIIDLIEVERSREAP